MKVVYTEEALKDLDAIADWLIAHYPTVAPAVERRIRRVVGHIARWPESARRSAHRPNVHVVPLGRYPYRIFIGSMAIGWRYSISITPRGSHGTNSPSPWAKRPLVVAFQPTSHQTCAPPTRPHRSAGP